jgi:hypothetical protein
MRMVGVWNTKLERDSKSHATVILMSIEKQKRPKEI